MSEKNGFIDGTAQLPFYQVLKGLFRDYRLKDKDVFVYMVLADQLRFLKQCAEKKDENPDEVVLYVGRDWIAKEMAGRAGVWTISKCLSRLRETGWIEAFQVNGKTNHYVLRDEPTEPYEVQVACEMSHTNPCEMSHTK